MPQTVMTGADCGPVAASNAPPPEPDEPSVSIANLPVVARAHDHGRRPLTAGLELGQTLTDGGDARLGVEGVLVGRDVAVGEDRLQDAQRLVGPGAVDDEVALGETEVLAEPASDVALRGTFRVPQQLVPDVDDGGDHVERRGRLAERVIPDVLVGAVCTL
jgi:hypothetical protein